MKIPHLDILAFLKVALISLYAFLTPIRGMMLLLGTAVFIDTIFAIYVVVKTIGWSGFKSKKLFNIVVKSFFYMGSILFAFLIDKYIIDKNVLFGIDLLISKIASIFWIYVEVKSIDETSIKLGNKSLYTIIKELLSHIKDIKKDVNEII